jgi:hypothetical protein
MIDFTCVFGQVGQIANPTLVPPILVPVSTGGSRTLEEVYAAASDNDILLHSDGGPLSSPISPGLTSVDELVLQDALDKLTHNAGNTRVERLAVIYASRYAPRPTVFGIMFDTSFRGEPGPAIGFLPREGCAVFLDAIGDHHQEDYFDQAAFTTVHELGHVFNLQHRTEPCYLHTSEFDQPPPREACRFVEDHRQLLRKCSSDASVRPGGSEFKDITGNGNEDSGGSRISSRRSESGLELVLSMHDSEFWSCTPVELQLTLQLKLGHELPVMVPDEIDPGYRRLALWIEFPDGERRRYRPTVHYCGNLNRIEISSERPFVRDISIFGQAGGYTFRDLGSYRLWATLDLPGKKRLISKMISVRVLPARARTKAARSEIEEQQHLLIKASRTLFYRSSKLRPTELHFLETLARRHPGTAGVAHYAIGRAVYAFLKASKHEGASHWLERARRHLSCAAEDPHLDKYRKQRAEERLAHIG